MQNRVNIVGDEERVGGEGKRGEGGRGVEHLALPFTTSQIDQIEFADADVVPSIV